MRHRPSRRHTHDLSPPRIGEPRILARLRQRVEVLGDDAGALIGEADPWNLE